MATSHEGLSATEHFSQVMPNVSQRGYLQSLVGFPKSPGTFHDLATKNHQTSRFCPQRFQAVYTQFDGVYGSTCEDLGISLAAPSPDADKAFEDVTCGVVLGILYDTEKWTWSMTEPKRLRFYHDLKDLAAEEWVTAKFAKSVNGKVQYRALL